MPDYRRNRVPGGTFFFTVDLRDRSNGVLVAHVDALRDTVRDIRRRSPFHAVKTLFSKTLPPTERRSPVRRQRGERGIWQRRCCEHTIRDDTDYASHMDYVHFNPVKHRLAEHAADWPFSSCRRAVAHGLYPADWAAGMTVPFDRGERRWGLQPKTVSTRVYPQQQACQRRAEGATLKELARSYNVGVATISRLPT